MVKDKEIRLTTNTAYLLNMWFKQPTTWKEVREFIDERHEEAWKGLREFEVEVIFKFKKKKVKKKCV